jgi:hypothetical protein
VARIQEGIREVCEAVPPAYGRWIGEQALLRGFP